MDRKQRRYSTVLLASTLLLAVSAASAAERPMNLTELDKVLDALLLLEETFEKRVVNPNTDPPTTFADQQMPPRLSFDTDPGGAAAQTPYENGPDGNPPTFRDAILMLWRMIAEDRMVTSTSLLNGGAYTRVADGIDRDIIAVSGTQLDYICGSSGASNRDRLVSKFELVATLANELVHPWQEPSNDTAIECDSERDSDEVMLEFLGLLQSALVNAGSPAGISDDCPALAGCVSAFGITAQQWSDLTNSVTKMTDAYGERRDEFDSHLNNGTSWEAYYRSQVRPHRWSTSLTELTGPFTLSVTGENTTTREYSLAPDHSIVQHIVTINASNQMVLSIFSQDLTGALHDHVYVDVDGDGLPEDSPVTTSSITPVPPLDEFELYVLPMAPGDSGFETTGHTLIDSRSGEIFAVPLDGAGLPAGPIALVHADPRLGDAGGGFANFGQDLLDPFVPDLAHWLFSDEPSVGQVPEAASAILSIDLLSGAWSSVPGPTTLAEARGPANLPGIVALAPGLDPVQLAGNPGDVAQLAAVGGGSFHVVAGPATVLSGGVTVPIVPSQPIGSGLYLIESGGNRTFRFLPPLGTAVGAAANDEDGDGNEERIHITVDPPRLHVLDGLSSPPGSPAWQHVAQYVLENPYARQPRRWNDVDGRILAGRFGDIDVTSFVFGGSRLYATSLHDFDGDAIADDAVVVRAPGIGALYQLEIWTNVLTTPVQTQLLAGLPITPETFSVVDLDGDGTDDVRMRDFFGGPDLCFVGDGAGMVEFGDCPEVLVTLTPPTLWPPNHRMVDVAASVVANNFCDTPTLVLGSVSSNEADDGLEDGSTVNDIQGAVVGTADLAFQLRAERSRAGSGRGYTVVYRAVDSCGNEASGSAAVAVPLDQAGVVEPVSLAVDETAGGTVVSWNVVPAASTYSVIRGELANLQETSTAIDLGPVLCIESGSIDLDTVGDEDTTDPASGASFFYLVEYDDGARSSYGTESADKPRAPSGGDCP